MDEEEILKIQELRKNGLSYTQIARKLLITKSQATYFSKLDLEEYDRKKTAKAEYENNVCELAKKSRNFNQLCKVLGKYPTNETIRLIKGILDKNSVDYSHFISEPESYKGFQKKKDINEFLVSGKTVSVTHLKERLLDEGLKEHKCERCGRTEWDGEEIPLQLHHINGDRTDNRLENLQILCPNCHALTDNYCSKKKTVEKNTCCVCGKEISRNAKYCEECYHNTETGKKFKKQSLTFDEKKLFELFKKYGNFKSVSKEFGVSDKTISKWFEKIGMPNKSKELREYFVSEYGPMKWDFLSGNADAFRDYQKSNFKKVDLIDEAGKVLKTYTSVQEIIEDGLYPDSVYRVCKGKLKSHHKRKFRYNE